MVSIKHQVNEYTMYISDNRETQGCLIYSFKCINDKTFDEYELDMHIDEIENLHILFNENISWFDDLIIDKPLIKYDESKQNIIAIFILNIGRRTEDIRIIIPLKQFEGDSEILELKRENRIIKKTISQLNDKINLLINNIILLSIHTNSINSQYPISMGNYRLSEKFLDNSINLIELSKMNLGNPTSPLSQLSELLKYLIMDDILVENSHWPYTPAYNYPTIILERCNKLIPSLMLTPLGKKGVSYQINLFIIYMCEKLIMWKGEHKKSSSHNKRNNIVDIYKADESVQIRDILLVFADTKLNLDDTNEQGETIFDYMIKNKTPVAVVYEFEKFRKR